MQRNQAASSTSLAGGRLGAADRSDRLLAAIATAGLGFQAVHVVEHLAQSIYWAFHTTAAPWLTPWAAAGRDVLAATTDGHPGSGNELLHLAGNVIFMVGLVAFVELHRRRRAAITQPLRVATWIQGLHIVEHLVLTGTWFVFDRAIGVTTVFGRLQGTAASSTRVWAHLALNMVASAYTVAAVAAWFDHTRTQSTRLATLNPPRPG